MVAICNASTLHENIKNICNKTSREQQHPSGHSPENWQPINGPIGRKLWQFCINPLLGQGIWYVLQPTGKPLLQVWGCKVGPISYRTPFVPSQLTLPFIAQGHIVGSTSYQPTSDSFHINRPSHSWDTAFLKFVLEKLKVKVMGDFKVQYHKVGPISCWLTYLSCHVIRPPHSRDAVFQNPTMKIQGQGHNSRSHSGSNFLLTHIPFIPCHQPSCNWDAAISKFDLLKSKVEVMGEVKFWSQNVGPTSYWHIPFVPTPFSNLILKIQGQGHSSWSQLFHSMSINPTIHETQPF